MDDQSDDQLLKELEDIAEGMDMQDDHDAKAESASSAGIAAVPKSEAKQQSLQAGESSSAQVKTKEESMKETPEAETNEDSTNKITPAAPVRKRGINMVMVSSTPEPSKPAEQPPMKKIAARIVKASPDEAAQQSAVATPPADAKAADGPSKVAAKKSPKRTAKPGDTGPTVKRAKNAFMVFSSDKRAALKAEHPDLSMGDMSKKLGELWKEASSEEKDKYKAMAEKDKNRAATERAQGKAPAAVANLPQTPRAKTAYQLFCDEERVKMRDTNPEAKFGELNTLLAAKWKVTPEANKERFQKAHQELKAQLSAPVKNKPKGEQAMQQDQITRSQEYAGNGDQNGPAEDVKVSQAACKQLKRNSVQQIAGVQGRDGASEGHLPEKGPAEDDTMIAEMMKVDWKAYPAEYIMAETADAKYLVKRKGLDFTDCGMVDARVAKRQRLQQPGPDDASQSPVSIAMVDEWEMFQKGFRCAVHAHNDGGELDLDDLNKGSPLEMCSFLVGLLRSDCLGILKEPDFPMHKAGKGQPTIKVPMLELSKAVQRVIDVERKACEKLREELAVAKAALAAKNDNVSAAKDAKGGKDAIAGGSEE